MGKEQILKFCAENTQKLLSESGKFVRNVKQPKINSGTIFAFNQNYARTLGAGKHKVPRFIYHMTNKANYEMMLRDGAIKTSTDAFLGKGVFTTELTNFFKHWRKSKSWGGYSLQERLVEHVAKGRDEIVILRIPTAKLSSDRLVIRSQNRLFSWGQDGKAKPILEAMEKEFTSPDTNRTSGWLVTIRRTFKRCMEKFGSKEVAEHLTTGAPAKMSGLYKQRKEALEYVYLDDILMSNVEKIGEVNVSALRQSAQYDPIRPMRSIFTSLLNGTPEVKGAELLTC